MSLTGAALREWYTIHSEYCHPALGLYCCREGCMDDLRSRGWFESTPEGSEHEK